MAFKLSELKMGDEILIKGTTINRLCDNKTHSVPNPFKNYVLFIGMKNSLNKTYAVNPDYGSIDVEQLKLEDIGSVKRNGELLYPKTHLTTKEKAFLLSLKPILKPSTRLIKFQSLGGLNEHIALIDVKTILKDRENVHLPTFKANSMYRGIDANVEYSLDYLGILLDEKQDLKTQISLRIKEENEAELESHEETSIEEERLAQEERNRIRDEYHREQQMRREREREEERTKKDNEYAGRQLCEKCDKWMKCGMANKLKTPVCAGFRPR